ncbi:2-hydroxyacid dehydrogenase [Variovorax sp. J22G21]|uniref:2-hydroxyacid dehydrogenase n=1 Tax=Variovorax fucosicus TaxID=3053517 RepID=UPI0025756A25|nr:MULTISPECIES: 2-hydroxyacid dehydrogenase [unclassified Variovorax]MDM0040826.1 2-hydroxyacid dehydrogenase [Variovorax sp. J22R193]MDM0059543.1 2-hydroxyacid dehydrogenase [Variovorax sp. J22G47]MDM0064766.1 2-hydroxyacid dehydrogenase [Variovorax sp. J22G21]
MSDKAEVLAVAPLMPFLMESLRAEYTVHDRIHVSDPAAFAAVAPRIRAVVANGEAKVPRELMAQLPALEMISVFGVGYDGVDVPAAHERGVPVTNTPEVLNDDVADLALGLLLSIARRIPQADRFVREGEWTKGPFTLSRKVTGARLGIVGMGRIGQAIAHRALAFQMDVSYTARSPRANVPYTYYPDAAALAAAVDFLVVITPGGAATRGMIDAKVLQALGPQGYLVNVARGSVVDQPALVAALQNGVIAGAALDVFVDEPNVPAELRNMPNVVLTPHVGSGTRQTREAMAMLTFNNLRAHFAGQPLLTPVAS